MISRGFESREISGNTVPILGDRPHSDESVRPAKSCARLNGGGRLLWVGGRRASCLFALFFDMRYHVQPRDLQSSVIAVV